MLLPNRHSSQRLLAPVTLAPSDQTLSTTRKLRWPLYCSKSDKVLTPRSPSNSSAHPRFLAKTQKSGAACPVRTATSLGTGSTSPRTEGAWSAASSTPPSFPISPRSVAPPRRLARPTTGWRPKLAGANRSSCSKSERPRRDARLEDERRRRSQLLLGQDRDFDAGSPASERRTRRGRGAVDGVSVGGTAVQGRLLRQDLHRRELVLQLQFHRPQHLRSPDRLALSLWPKRVPVRLPWPDPFFSLSLSLRTHQRAER